MEENSKKRKISMLLKAFKYGFILLITSALCGFFYGVFAGAVLETMFFSVVIVGVFTAINFLLAFLVYVCYLIVRLFGKKSTAINYYFVYSMIFFLIFLPVFVIYRFSNIVIL